MLSSSPSSAAGPPVSTDFNPSMGVACVWKMVIVLSKIVRLSGRKALRRPVGAQTEPY